MNHSPPIAETLLGDFAVLAEANGGVARFRQLLLDLAIRGGLSRVEGEESSEHAPTHFAIAADEVPYRLASGWTWARLPQVVSSIQIGPFGSLLHKSDYIADGTPLVNPANIRDGEIVPDSSKGVGRETLQRLRNYCMKRGDVVVGRRGEMGKCAVINAAQDGWLCGTGSLFLRPSPSIDSDFLALWVRSPSVRRRLEAESVGSTMNNLNLRVLTNIVIALPPLAEQKRIVAKVDQLMGLCDELEARQAKKRDISNRLTKSALQALTTAEGPEEFDAAWKRVVENFDVLIDRAEKVGELRGAVLDLAFSGRLVAPMPGDGSAAPLRAEIDRDWSGRQRKTELVDPAEHERPASPERWLWARLGNLAEIVGGVTKGRDLRGKAVRAYPYLRVANVQRGHLDLTVMKEIEISVDELEKYKLVAGDVLFTEGGDWDKLGRSCVWQGEVEACIHQNHVFRARMVSKAIGSSWISQFGNSPTGRRYFEDAAKQTTNLASINMTQLRAFPVPLPPIGEQRRIVAKVEQLMKVCDELEARLTRAEDRAAKLVEAVVQELVA